jgi:hypothetical protein
VLNINTFPQIKITDDWDSSATYPTQPPVCDLAGSSLSPSRPAAHWSQYAWKNEKFYLQTKTPDAEITFDVQVRPGAIGEIAISYLRSAAYDLGKLSCRVTDQQVTVDGYWKRSISVAQ